MNLITGGTGFLGAHLLLFLLRKGESVRAIYRNEKSLKKVKDFFKERNESEKFKLIEWIQADINNIPSIIDIFDSVEYVYHSAALISFDPKDEEELRKVNIEGTSNLVNIALKHPIKKFCYVSSIATLGDLSENETTITEETEWNAEKAHSDYALSKKGGEMEVLRAGQEGLPNVIVNPGVILGNGFWEHGSGSIFSAVFNELPFYTKGSSGFIAVEDVCKLVYFLTHSDSNNERFTLVAKNIKFKSLIDWICEAGDVKKPRFYAKPWMTEIAWRIDKLIAFLFFRKRKMSRATSKSLHSTALYSNEKILGIVDHSFLSIEMVTKKVSRNFKDSLDI
ncbi:MAG: SDR family oxidoreductase [Flavobacterium sp.]